MNLSRILISIVGTKKSPHHENWIECCTTWVPLLRKLGYKVIVLLVDDKISQQYTLREDFFISKCEDSKKGLFYKKILNPIKWILENNDFDYYFPIDSDSFVHPLRFEKMLYDNFDKFKTIDYMGCPIPYNGIHPSDSYRKIVNDYSHASGCAYMISRKSMEYILDEYNNNKENIFKENCWEDCVVGDILLKKEVPLLVDTRIYLESKFNLIIGNPHNVPIPYIGDQSGKHLAIQHYVNGHMEEISTYLDLF
jgi:hypothetical protein